MFGSRKQVSVDVGGYLDRSAAHVIPQVGEDTALDQQIAECRGDLKPDWT
jgi:hypothetical protein